MDSKLKTAAGLGAAIGLAIALISCSPDSGDKKPLSPQDEAALKAKQAADSTNCLATLKQIGDAMHKWAEAHDGRFPKSFILMSNELAGWKLLRCPGDSTRGIPDLAQVKSEDLSYKIVSIGPNATVTNLDLVLLQCAVHGSICVSDGNVYNGSMELQKRLKPSVDGTVHLVP